MLARGITRTSIRLSQLVVRLLVNRMRVGLCRQCREFLWFVIVPHARCGRGIGQRMQTIFAKPLIVRHLEIIIGWIRMGLVRISLHLPDLGSHSAGLPQSPAHAASSMPAPYPAYSMPPLPRLPRPCARLSARVPGLAHRQLDGELARHRQTLLDPHCVAWNTNRHTQPRAGALGRPWDGAHPVAGGVPSPPPPLHELINNVLRLSMIGPWAGDP